jgi:hypothetical protein
VRGGDCRHGSGVLWVRGSDFTQSFHGDQAERRSDGRRLGHRGFGRALNDRGSFRLGGGKRARDHVEDPAHQEAVTAPLKGADGTVADLECGSPVV